MPDVAAESEDLRASIGNASFHVRSAKATVGRRIALQEFPNTDVIRGQDLGPKADAFEVEGYLIGSDYRRKREALEQVFRQPGPHLLVHPFRGRMQVIVEGSLSIDEDVGRIGYATISFRCRKWPNLIPDDVEATPASGALDAVAQARTQTASSLAGQIDEHGDPRAREAFRSAMERVQRVLRRSIDAISTGTDAIVPQVDLLIETVDSVFEAPLDAFVEIASIVRAVIKAPFVTELTLEGEVETLSNERFLTEMLGLAGRFIRTDESELEPLAAGSLGPLTAGATPSALELRNARTLTAALRAEAAATIVETIVTKRPASRTQARRALDVVSTLLVGVSDGDPDSLLHAVDGEAFVALSDLRAAANRFVREELVELPEISTYEVPSDTNALLLAELLLGDASAFGELVDRNDLADPLFVPAGTPLEFIRRT